MCKAKRLLITPPKIARNMITGSEIFEFSLSWLIEMNKFSDEESFEKLNFDSFSTKDIFLKDNIDRHAILSYVTKSRKLDSPCYTRDRLISFSSKKLKYFVNVVHQTLDVWKTNDLTVSKNHLFEVIVPTKTRSSHENAHSLFSNSKLYFTSSNKETFT